jgi:hypothetical protein
VIGVTGAGTAMIAAEDWTGTFAYGGVAGPA